MVGYWVLLAGRWKLCLGGTALKGSSHEKTPSRDSAEQLLAV